MSLPNITKSNLYVIYMYVCMYVLILILILILKNHPFGVDKYYSKFEIVKVQCK